MFGKKLFFFCQKNLAKLFEKVHLKEAVLLILVWVNVFEPIYQKTTLNFTMLSRIWKEKKLKGKQNLCSCAEIKQNKCYCRELKFWKSNIVLLKTWNQLFRFKQKKGKVFFSTLKKTLHLRNLLCHLFWSKNIMTCWAEFLSTDKVYGTSLFRRNFGYW